MVSNIIGWRKPGDDTVYVLRADADGGPHQLLGDVGSYWSNSHRASLIGEEIDIAGTGGTIVPPIPLDACVFCVGLNYRAHVAEGSYADEVIPEYPTIFGRWTRSLGVDGDDVRTPHDEDGLDWEGEVAILVGATLRDASPQDCADAIFAYAAFNDITARRAQKLTSQWTLGKNVDGSGILGPAVLRSDVGQLSDGLLIETRVNGVTQQRGSTADMMHDAASILAYISRSVTIRPGDIVATGTPSGVGYARKPPILLAAGDIVTVEVEKIGLINNSIVR